MDTSSELASLRVRVAELEAAEQRHKHRCESLQRHYHNCPFGYQSLDADGRLTEINRAWLDFLGYSRDEVIGKPFAGFLLPDQQELFLEKFLVVKGIGEAVESELKVLGKDGTTISISCNGWKERESSTNGATHWIIQDITRQKQLEEQHEAEREFLRICQFSSGTLDLMQQLVAFFKRFTGCEAVGVRLRLNDDFPYYETSGFPEWFVKAENALCVHDEQGELLRDSAGNPILECMCGNILCRRFDPALSFFTANGSFWTNSTSELLATTSEKERQSGTRNRCNGASYESVALIPLQNRDTTFGLFQFNDRCKGRFTPELVKLLEHLVTYISLTLAKHLADEELRTSEEKYRLVVEHAQEAIIVSQDERLVLVNPAAIALGGYSMEELTAEPFIHFIHPEDRQTVAAQHLGRLRGEAVPTFLDFRVICRDGRIKWLKGHGSRIEWHGKPATLNFLTDITEQRLAEIQRQENELNFRALLEASPETISLLDTEGRTLIANQTTAKRLQRPLDEIIGRVVFDFFPPDVAARRRKYCQQVIETGQHMLLQDEREGIVLESHLCPVIDPSGKVCRIAVFAMDITERKRAEQQLTESHQLLNNLARLVPGVIYQYRLYPDGRSAFPYSSPGINLIYEVTPDDVREDATTVFSRLHPEDRDRVAEAIFASARTLETFYCEFRVILPRQGLRWRWSQAQPQRTEDGGTLWHGIILDVTERKQAEEEKKKLTAQLQQAQKMEAIGTLAGGIAHDFNNILSAILGYAELARDEGPDHSNLADDIDQILKAGNRAKELVKQILAFSRQAKADHAVLQPALILVEAIKLLRASLPATISIKQDIDPEAGVILADPTQIHQILMNLCTNAFHAMEMKGGTLTISLQRKIFTEADLGNELQGQPGEYLQLSVRDTGEGIAPEIKERIFDPYFTTKEIGKGTGMGLAMVHGIVKSYGGFITCDSRLGEGTVFQVALPIAKDLPPERKEAGEPVSAGKEHILLIDDEDMLVEMGRAMLERLGYRVTTKTNSLEALTDFLNEPGAFDLVITDQTMPGMTGADLARRMLRLRPDMPIILCTGYSNLVSEEKAKSLGIMGFAAKPLTKKSLATLIRSVLDENKNKPHTEDEHDDPYYPGTTGQR